MAIVQNPLISRASGKQGTTSFTKWKTKNVTRALPFVAYPASSPAQVSQQAKFINSLSFFSYFSLYSQYLYDERKQVLTYLQFFQQQNVGLFRGDSYVIDKENIQYLALSRGPGLIASFYDYDFISRSLLYVEVCFPAFYDLVAADYSPIWVCINHTQMTTFVEQPGPSAFTYIVFDMPDTDGADDLYLFYCLYNSLTREISNSLFLVHLIAP